nr:hypothetical protein [Candidatus Sigynarchaeota archaeon]
MGNFSRFQIQRTSRGKPAKIRDLINWDRLLADFSFNEFYGLGHPFCAMNSIRREAIETKLAKQKVKTDPNEVAAKAKEFVEREVLGTK